MKIKTLCIALGAAAFVSVASSSCSGVRGCAEPQLNLPEALAGNSVDSATVADTEWWKFYTDSALVDIINQTLANNRDLLASSAKIEQMRQLYGIDRANILPTVSALALADHETNDYYGKPHSEQPEFSLKASVSWEVDLWGGLTWKRREGAAEFASSVEARRALKVSLIAQAAEAYITLQALDNELSIVRRTLFTREEYLKKARLRFEAGLTSETVYSQAVVEHATTAALIPALESRIAATRNTLTLLMGRYPEAELARGHMSLSAETDLRPLPVGLPSTLLERRPDLRRARADLQAALAGVGVAYADRFPKLRIGLTGGLENDDLKGFLRSPFTYVVGQITGTILDFGRNKRRHRAAIAAYDQSRLAYEQAVLTAFREADDAVTALRTVRQTCARRRELLQAAQQYARLAYVQYSGGAIGYIDVLDAQRRYFEAQVGVNNAVRDERLALVQLYKVLGGGW